MAMSGGVDSSVAAAMLVERGYGVTGLTLRLFDCPVRGGCDYRDAKSAARKLSIPHRLIDARAEFKRRVITPFLKMYAAGRTPNPCVMCNEHVKFGILLRKARELGAEALATGHYARAERRGGRSRLFEAKDRRRDQSYFLYRLTGRNLERVIFPLGAMSKEDVRRAAVRFGIRVAGKRASREICFVPGGDLKNYLGRRIPSAAGRILDGAGRVVGGHRGIHNFTVGQRRGLGLSSARRLYVVALDARRKTVVVGPDESLWSAGCVVGSVSLVHGVWPKRPVKVRIRSQHPGVTARIIRTGPRRAVVRFASPQRAVTPGQAAVFYLMGEVIGGGTIESGSPVA